MLETREAGIRDSYRHISSLVADIAHQSKTPLDALVSLDWQSGCVMLGICIVVSMVSGVAVFRLTKSSSVVERIPID